MKTVRLAAAAIISSLFTGSAMAAVEGNIGVTSEYMWRGMKQSNGAAVSGGLDWSNDSGWSAGIWTSNVNWGDSGTETDYYGGYSSSLGSIDYSISGAYYAYEGGSSVQDSNFAELLVDLSYGGFDFGFAYTPFADTKDYEDDLFYYVGKSFDLTDDISAGITLGQYVSNKTVDFTNSQDVENSSSYHDARFAQVDITKGDLTLSIIKADDDSVGDDNRVTVADLTFTVSWGTTF